jgi:hypothetical protein
VQPSDLVPSRRSQSLPLTPAHPLMPSLVISLQRIDDNDVVRTAGA